MAVTATPIHVQTVKHASAAVTVANTNADGTTGTYATVMTAGSNGSKVERLEICTQGTNAANKVRLFINNKIWREYLFSAVTPSNTVANQTINIDCSQAGNALYLAASETITANVNTTGDTYVVHAFYGDY
jgi:hypothetical protein